MLQPAKSGVLFAKHNDGVGRNAGGKYMLGVAGDAGGSGGANADKFRIAGFAANRAAGRLKG